MASSFDGLGHFFLIFQRSSRKTSRQYLTLLIHKFLQEFTVFIIDVFDTAFLETAVFLFLDIHCNGCNVFDV